MRTIRSVSLIKMRHADVNIVSALLAKQRGARRVIARINNNEYLTTENRILFTELGIDLLFYPESIAATEILDLLKLSGTSEFMDFSGGRLQLIVLKLMESSSIVNKSMGQIAEEAVGDLPFRILFSNCTIWYLSSQKEKLPMLPWL